jgi:hypothetical protein
MINSNELSEEQVVKSIYYLKSRQSSFEDDLYELELTLSSRADPCNYAVAGPYIYIGESDFKINLLSQMGKNTMDLERKLSEHTSLFLHFYDLFKPLYVDALRKRLLCDQSEYRREFKAFERDLELGQLTKAVVEEFKNFIFYNRDDAEYGIETIKKLNHDKCLENFDELVDGWFKIDEELREFLPNAVKAYVIAGESFPKPELFPSSFWWRKVAYNVYRQVKGQNMN